MLPEQISGSVAVSTKPPDDARLRDVAEKLEASFLSEMLKSARVGRPTGPFGGGAGEDQFASLLRDEQARQMAAAGGIGLAETVFHALKDRAHD